MNVLKYSPLTAAVASLSMAISCAEPMAPVISGDSLTAASASIAPVGGLIECPTDQTARAQRTIGLLGGSITAGGTTITIPIGAVLLPRTFEVTVPASRHMEVDISAVGSEHYQFLLPATVTIDYSRCGTSAAVEAPLVAYHIDVLTKVLLELMIGQDDKGSRKLTFTTGHLSGYAIAN